MIAVIIGYPGSQKIVPASKYLFNKYLFATLTPVYLNYTGEINGWASYVADFLEYLTEENIVFALDDYLICDRMNIIKFSEAVQEMGGDTVCIKLCHCTPEENEEYPVTTQYTIWNRQYLISLLRRVSTPWEFEMTGSLIFDKTCLHRPCIKYFTNSSISGRWNGIDFTGVSGDDMRKLRENKFI